MTVTRITTYKCDSCSAEEVVQAGRTTPEQQPQGWSRATMVKPVLAAMDPTTMFVESHLCPVCTDMVTHILLGAERSSVPVAEPVPATDEK